MRKLIALSLFAVACVPAAGPGLVRSVTLQTPQECTQLCTDMGMKMSAVVVVGDKAGCVCEPPAAPPHAGNSKGASVALTIAIADKLRQDALKQASHDHTLLQEQQLQEDQKAGLTR